MTEPQTDRLTRFEMADWPGQDFVLYEDAIEAGDARVRAVLDRLAAAVTRDLTLLMEQRATLYPSSAAFTAIAQAQTRVLAIIAAEQEASHE